MSTIYTLTLRRTVSGETQNSSGNLKFLPGIWEFGNFSGRHEVIKLNFSESLKFLGECLPKFKNDIPNFREDFYFDMVLLKQRLLVLSPPVIYGKKDIFFWYVLQDPGDTS